MMKMRINIWSYLICSLALFSEVTTAKAEIPLDEDFFSPWQIYKPFHANEDDVITTIKSSDDIYFKIHDEEDGIYAELTSRPEGEKPYSGNFVIPDYVDYITKSGQKLEVPVVYIDASSIGYSEIEELYFNNIIGYIGQENGLSTCKTLKRIIIPQESGIIMCDSWIKSPCLKEIVFGKNVVLSRTVLYSRIPVMDLSESHVLIESSAMPWLPVDRLILPGDFKLYNEPEIEDKCPITRIDFSNDKIPENNILFHSGDMSNMYALKEIHCSWTIPPIIDDNADKNYKYGSCGVFDNCTVFVPFNLVETYRKAPGWKNFKNIRGETLHVESTNIDKTITKNIFFNTLGQQVTHPSKGSIIIERKYFKDGSTETCKTIFY